jgi:hypothetical protein
MQLLLKPETLPEDLSPSANGFDSHPPAPLEPAPPPDTSIFDDEMVTQAFDIQPKDKPRYTPPYLTAEQMGFDRLVFYSEDEPTITAKLDKDHLSIGRAKNRDIVLEGSEISRRHARIERLADGAFYITDLGSVNGVLVGNQRIPVNAPIRLSPEQIVRIGNYWMEYEPKRELPPGAVLPVPSKLYTGEFSLDDYVTVVIA